MNDKHMAVVPKRILENSSVNVLRYQQYEYTSCEVKLKEALSRADRTFHFQDGKPI